MPDLKYDFSVHSQQNISNCTVNNNSKQDKVNNSNSSLFDNNNTLKNVNALVSDSNLEFIFDIIDKILKTLGIKKQDEEPEEKEKQTDKNKNTVNLNGEIDNFRQGDTNDCWLLSGLFSLNNCKNGKQLLKDTIKINDNSALVYFPGINCEVEVSNKAIADAKKQNKYSTGDDDVVLIELAVKEIFSKIKNGEIDAPKEIADSINDSNDVLDDGNLQDLIYLYTGEFSYVALNDTRYNTNQYAKYYKERTTHDINYVLDLKENNNENFVATLSMNLSNNAGHHAYSVKSVNDDTVTLFNPLNSKESNYTRQEIQNLTDSIKYAIL